MKKIFFIFFFATNAFAAHYHIVVDANSTETRLHLFEINNTVQEIFSESTTPPLGDFLNHPNDAGESLKLILDDAKAKIPPFTDNVGIDVFGTDIMREIDAEKIYTSVKLFLKNYPFDIERVETLSGKMQGVYYWLANQSSYGMIHAGSYSTQITYVTKDTTPSADIIKLDSQNVTLFSKNFSFGQENSLQALKIDPHFYTCLPIDYPPNGQFNFKTCGGLYQNLIQKNFQEPNLSDFKNQTWLIFGENYEIFQFLAADIPDKWAFINRLQYVCNLPWPFMKKEYDFISETKLATMCAHSTLIEALLFEALHLQAHNIQLTRQKINWPLGYILFKKGFQHDNVATQKKKC